MRQPPIGLIVFLLRYSPSRVYSDNSVLPGAKGWFPALFLAASAAMVGVRAQEPGAEPAQLTTTPAPAPSTVASVTPLPRFVPRDNLLFYFDFEGLDTHDRAWRKTAAYKILNSTSLGVMLEEVASQLLDRAVNQMPGHEPSGADLLRLVKMVAQKGCVLALNTNPNGPDPFVGTLVLRGGSTPENKAFSNRLLGLLMGPGTKPRTERQRGRVLVYVPRGPSPEAGWVWWPEKDDLVIGFMQPSNATSILDTLDGKTPSAASNPLIQELTRTEGSFTPLLRGLVDLGTAPAASGKASMGMPQPRLTAGLTQFRTAMGVDRIDFRWGFDGDTLQSITRLVAPAPRKNMLTLFDQPPLRTGHLIPLPDGVDTFVAVSVSPSKVLETLDQTASLAGVKVKLDDLAEKLRTRSSIDFEKDFLGNLGPRIVMYMAQGHLVAATDEGAQPPPGVAALGPMARFFSLQSVPPKLTLVAELKDPVAFGKALDALMLQVNKKLKAEATEKAAEEAAREQAAGAAEPSGPDRFGKARARRSGRVPTEGGKGPGSGGRPSRRRSPRQTPAPEFRLMPSQMKTYTLIVPPESSWKIVPSGVRPTIQMSGEYVVLASTSEAAHVALQTVRQNAWKPSVDVKSALSRLPDRPMIVALFDPRESQPGLLASLPGTLQAQINTVIATSAGKAGRPGAVSGTSNSPSVGGGPAPGPDSGPRMRPGKFSAAEPGGGGVPPSGDPAGTGHSDTPAVADRGSAGSQEDWIELKVDPAHLPKAEELKSLMFPATLAVVADEQSIRLVTRESFPNLYASAAAGAVALSLTLPALQGARARAGGAPDGRPGELAPGRLGSSLPAAGQGSFSGAEPGTAGATAPAPPGAVAPVPLGPRRLGGPGPGNRGPG